ncbi:MAG: alkaline phosphatase family protein [Anaerolineales bacterium]|nr:alkaline phosphatase family protein [Anaerolineales bacterium]
MTLNDRFVRPRYDGACFGNLPQTIIHLLTGQGRLALPTEVFGGLPIGRYQTIVLFFVDAFGWRFFKEHRDSYPFLREIVQKGAVTKLTTEFPSTTAAHVTCIHTGLSVGQSGVYEWQYYEPEFDAIIAPLLYSYAGTTERETLPAGIDPRRLFPTGTIYHELGRHGIQSFAFQHRDYTPSTFSDVVFSGAETRPYRTVSEALVNMRELLLDETSGSRYIFFYHGGIDTISHQYGPGSPQLKAEIDTFLTSVDRIFWRELKKLENTLFVLVADHGQVDIDPATTIYLNVEPEFAGIEKLIKTNRKGDLLVPAGSCRDMFLYIKEGMLDQALEFLAGRLRGKAEVYRTQDLISEGLFGPPPLSPAMLSRLGNLVILPYEQESVWWYEKGFEQKHYGHHGGLTPQEAEIPLLLYSF